MRRVRDHSRCHVAPIRLERRTRRHVAGEVAVEDPVAGPLGDPRKRHGLHRPDVFSDTASALLRRVDRVALRVALRIDREVEPVQMQRMIEDAYVHDAEAYRVTLSEGQPLGRRPRQSIDGKSRVRSEPAPRLRVFREPASDREDALVRHALRVRGIHEDHSAELTVLVEAPVHWSFAGARGVVVGSRVRDAESDLTCRAGLDLHAVAESARVAHSVEPHRLRKTVPHRGADLRARRHADERPRCLEWSARLAEGGGDERGTVRAIWLP